MTLDPDSVLNPSEVVINGIRFKTAGRIARQLSSVFPGKVVLGDFSEDSHPTRSSYSLSDWTGGIGIERMEGSEHVDRLWQTTLNPIFSGHLVLGPKADEIPTPVGSGQVLGLAELAGTLYGVFEGNGNQKHVFSYDGASWSVARYTFTGFFNSIGHVDFDGDDHLIVCHSLGVGITTDGVNWTTQAVV